jgi:phage terminase large subunit-like protein
MKVRDIQEKALLLQTELLTRRKDDALHNFVPHAKQEEFIEAMLSGEHRQAWFLAANRSGKSDAGSYIGAHKARYGNRKVTPVMIKSKDGKQTMSVSDYATSGWVVSLDFPTSRDIIQPKYFNNGFVPPGSHPPFIPQREIKEWRVSDQVLKLNNGSIIGFKSTDSQRIKFQGTEKDWIHFDEEPPKGHYDECMIRVGRRPLYTWMTCTLLPPEGQVGGVTWIFPQIIKPWQRGENPHILVFTASIYDNPYIGKDEVRFLEAIYPEGSVQRRIRLQGELLPGISGARCYPGFDANVHVCEQLKYYSPHRALCWTIDFNVSPFISLVGQRDGNVFRILSELVLEEGNHPEMCQYFVERFNQHRGEIWMYGDATGARRTAQTGKTDYTIILNEMRRHGVNLRLKVPNVNPHVPDRINAVNRSFRTEDAEVCMQIDPECKELIDDLEQVLRDPHGGIKKSHNNKDSYYRRTHSSDALGYWLAYEAPVTTQRNFGQRIFEQIASTVKKPGYGFTR